MTRWADRLPKEEDDRAHVFELMGGVGNQLFQLHAARNLCPNPVFDLSRAEWPINHHRESSVEPLIHEAKTNRRESIGPFFWELEEDFQKIARKFTSTELFWGRWEPPIEMSSIQIQEFLRKSTSPLRIRGYFQSLDLIGFSEEFGSLERLQIEVPVNVKRSKLLEIDWIALHIRKGDTSRRGMDLDAEYYERALRLLLQRTATRNLVVFTDDESKCNGVLSQIECAREFSIEYCPNGLSALQTIFLMSTSRATVTANSTFSWWGAITNPDAEAVITPLDWRGVDKGQSTSLIPNNWIKV